MPLESGGSPGTFGGGMGDFLSGFNQASDEIRSRNAAEQATKDARDEKVFQALANSDDPDIRAAAVTGMLTGKHPAKGMDKWFGTVQNHPSYDTIKTLVGQGHQPFIDPTQRHAKELEADINAKLGTIQKADLSPEQKTRATLGVYGAPPPRPMPLESGTLVYDDGSTEAGFFDRSEGSYYDQSYGAPGKRVKEFRRNGAGGGTQGDSEKVEPDKGSSTGYSNVRRDRGGKELFRVEAPAPGTGTTGGQPYEFVPTPGGIIAGNKRTGTVGPAAGGAGVVRSEPPTANVQMLRSLQSDLLKLHPPPAPAAGGLIKPTDDDMAQWRTKMDAEAQRYGFTDYADLQQRIGAAGEDVTAGTPPPQVPGKLGAKPTKPTTDTDKQKLDVNAILNQLKKNRGAGMSPAPPR